MLSHASSLSPCVMIWNTPNHVITVRMGDFKHYNLFILFIVFEMGVSNFPSQDQIKKKIVFNDLEQ